MGGLVVAADWAGVEQYNAAVVEQYTVRRFCYRQLRKPNLCAAQPIATVATVILINWRQIIADVTRRFRRVKPNPLYYSDTQRNSSAV